MFVINRLAAEKYTIYVHCLTKYINSFVRALETGRKLCLWRDILTRFAASANQFDIY